VMRTFVAYTLARLGLFLAVYGVIWLAVGRGVRFDSISGLYTALIALVVSSLIAFVALRGLRERLAAEVAARAGRARAASATTTPGGNHQAEQHPGAVQKLGEPGVTQDRDQR
jgi:uncharacterized membrane protein YdjX (TVP38/TMEM64 family)